MPTANPTLSDLKGFVFVVTYGRSGSTLVQNLLNSIDGYCIRGENNNVITPLARAYQSLAHSQNLKNLRKNKTETLPDDPWFGGQLTNPTAMARAMAQMVVRDVLAPPPGTRVTGFKEIRWGANLVTLGQTLDFMAGIFPNTKFIFNTRNHDEVAQSGWWVKTPPDQVSAQLTAQEAVFTQYLEKHPTRGIAIHYNDYVKDVDAFAPLFAFLGEPFDRDRAASVLSVRLNHLK